MEQMFVLSKKDLETSLHLNPKSYLAILHLLNIAQFEGNSQAAENYLMLGVSVLPSNMILRIRYLIQLTPRWGGSYKSMESFISKCQSQGLSHDKIDLLNAIKHDDKGFVLEEQGKTVEARLAYEEALKLSLSGNSRFRQDYLKYSLRICAKQEHSTKQYCLR
ncbi:MAG: tetratricopeptide (TPR) repeat protein [Burkholderiaceae bacterium]|jgi:tetratricopeptide (TPR) repeat protein